MQNYIVTAVEKGRVLLKETAVKEPGPKELQVRVHTTLISPGTERATILAMENTPGAFPMNMGYSAVGTVVKTGSEVTGFKEGDRIACFSLNHCNIGNVNENFCVKVEPEIPDMHAAFLALGVIGLQGVRKARIELGESVMVLGLGPIGQLALQLAKANGGLPVIGVDRFENRMKLAADTGADAVLNSGREDWQAKLKDITGDEGPQVVIESTGFPEPINMALQVVRKFGRVVLLGSTRGETTANFYATVHRKALAVLGAHIMGNPVSESRPGFWTWKDDARAFLQLVKHKKLDLEPLITEKIKWQEVENTYKKLLQGDPDMVIPMIDWQ